MFNSKVLSALNLIGFCAAGLFQNPETRSINDDMMDLGRYKIEF